MPFMTGMLISISTRSNSCVLHRVESGFAIVDDGGVMAGALEDLGDDHLIGPVVLGDQD